MQRSVLISLLSLMVLMFSLSACATVNTTDNNNQQTAKKEEQPIVLDVYVSATGKQFDREIETEIDPESLEQIFDFYGFYDKARDNYRIIYADYQKQDNPLKGSFSDVYRFDYQSFIDLLSQKMQLETQQYDNLRLTIKDGASLRQATMTGTAFADYTKYKTKDFKQKQVSVVNSAEGFSLIIADNQPYLTSTDNLSFLEEEKEVLNQEADKSKFEIYLWDLFANDATLKLNQQVDYVLPKWLSLKDEQGNIKQLYSQEYHANIKAQGADIYALVNNSFDPELTHKMLNSEQTRDTFNQQLMDYCLAYNIKGINLDFENMKLADSDAYIQLIAELKALCVANNIHLSACITVPDGSDSWSKVFDRKRMGKLCDHLMLMAYDQYYAGSKVAGPVAGYTWVDENIQKTLTMVPKDKLILGVPFYTRLWYESVDEKVPNHSKVKSKDVFMSAALNIIQEKKPVRVWDETNKQNYYAYYDQSHMVKFWYEGPVSVSNKSELAKKYQLNGLAYWALGFETAETWDKIKEVIGE